MEAEPPPAQKKPHFMLNFFLTTSEIILQLENFIKLLLVFC